MKKELLLAYFPKMTYKRYQELMTVYPSLEAAWASERGTLRELGWSDTFIHEWLVWKDEINEERIEASLEEEGIEGVTIVESTYPPLLRQIYDPPLALFVRGQIESLPTPLAVVGTRLMTDYGRYVTNELVTALTNNGVTIVSGLAFGVDAQAHKATLAAAGKTVAVLGTGIDRQHVYPRAHVPLSEQILKQGGALVSEYPPGSLATQYGFPRRNRIIAGMSHATLVIEAGESSGALITAQCSLDAGREVFTVPQNITSPTAVGPNNLLKMGAHPVTTVLDILDVLHISALDVSSSHRPVVADSPVEATLLKYLSRAATHIDELIRQTALPSATVMSTMTLMEMKGQVRNVGGMMYVVAR